MDRTVSIFVLAVVVLTTASCTAPRESSTTTTSVPTTTTVPLTPEEAAGEFHSCLTEQGLIIPEIPLDQNGRPDLSALADATRQDAASWQEALTTCAAVIVANGALDLSAEPELAEAVRGRLLAFSACMRSQGVEDFPDPAADFDGTAPPFPISTIPVADPELGTAAEACASTIGSDVEG
jgi:hypothetical protein